MFLMLDVARRRAVVMREDVRTTGQFRSEGDAIDRIPCCVIRTMHETGEKLAERDFKAP